MRFFRSMRVFRLFQSLLLGACVWPASLPAAELLTVGWIERVKLDGLVITAKLDTGAKTASLHASEIRQFVRDDGDWVAFDVSDKKGQKRHFEKKVSRVSQIKRLSGNAQNRPTVVMGVCLGKICRSVEVNLVDRTGFNYEFLLGRSFMADYFIVDPARTFTVEPDSDGVRTP
jgi:hypothetical protein